jgi:hypothetical protein
MAKKRKSDDESGMKDLWITPRYSLKGPAGERAWDNRLGGTPNSSRFLDLADIALGIKKTTPHKKKLGQPLSIREKQKTEPYSSNNPRPK